MNDKDVAWRQVEEYIAHQKEVKESEQAKGEKKEHEQKH